MLVSTFPASCFPFELVTENYTNDTICIDSFDDESLDEYPFVFSSRMRCNKVKDVNVLKEWMNVANTEQIFYYTIGKEKICITELLEYQFPKPLSIREMSFSRKVSTDETYGKPLNDNSAILRDDNDSLNGECKQKKQKLESSSIQAKKNITSSTTKLLEDAQKAHYELFSTMQCFYEENSKCVCLLMDEDAFGGEGYRVVESSDVFSFLNKD